MTFRLTFRRAALLGLVFAGPIAACGSKGGGLPGGIDDSTSGNGSSSGGDNGSSSGASGGGNSSGTASSGGTGVFVQNDSGMTGGTIRLSPDAACAFSSQMGSSRRSTRT